MLTLRIMVHVPAALAMVLHIPVAAQSVSGMTFSQKEPVPVQLVDQLQHQERIARAHANLIALTEGRLSASDLSPVELQDVLDLDRMLRGNAVDTRTPAQQCVDAEVRKAGGNPSRLAWSVIRLKCR